MDNFVDKPNYFNLEYFFYHLTDFVSRFWYSITHDPFLSTVTFISIIVIILLVIGIVYFTIRLRDMKRVRLVKLYSHSAENVLPEPKNERWEQVKKHIASDNQAEWKLAIIEADLILEEVINTIRPGDENFAERMKKIHHSSFATIQDAWEAHKVRNRIAHEGSLFTISRPAAQKVIGLYENVFHEFKYI